MQQKREKELDETGSQPQGHQFFQRPFAWGAISFWLRLKFSR